MLALPSHTPSCAVYLLFGILPAEAMRDLDILGLLGQVAMCSEDQQNVTAIIRSNLQDFDISFSGWSSLARKTTEKYFLPDPSQYMSHPWIPDRWRRHCKSIITDIWDEKLRQEASSKPTLHLLDIPNLSSSIPHRIYENAGLDSMNVMKCTTQMWFLTGVYHTNQLLHKMNKVNSPLCNTCQVVDDISHVLLYCGLFTEIRQQFIHIISTTNPHILKYSSKENIMLRVFLDPESSFLPPDISNGWVDLPQAYKLCRDVCWNIQV